MVTYVTGHFTDVLLVTDMLINVMGWLDGHEGFVQAFSCF